MKQFIIIFLSFCTLSLTAQDLEPSVERKGFVIGIGVSAGAISISDNTQEVPFDKAHGGFSLPNLKIGFMLTERMALLATFPGMNYEYEGKDRSFDALVPTLQYWVSDRWWVNGGFGLAMDLPAFYEKNARNEDYNFGCAVAAGVGYEVVQSGKFTIDIQSNVQLGRVFLDEGVYRDAAAISFGVGFNWY